MRGKARLGYCVLCSLVAPSLACSGGSDNPKTNAPVVSSGGGFNVSAWLTGGSPPVATGGAPATGGTTAVANLWKPGSTLQPYTGSSSAILGSLDGTSIDFSAATGSKGWIGSLTTALFWSVDDMRARVWTWNTLSANQAVSLAGGIVILYTPLPHADELLCVDAGHILLSSSGSLAISLESLSSLGTCTGASGTGSVDLTYNTTAGGTASGTIGGVAISSTSASYSCWGDECEWTMNGEYVAFILDYDWSAASSAVQGYVVFFGSSSTPARFACVGNGSTFTKTGSSFDETKSLHLTGISDFMTCPGKAMTGSLGIGIPAN